MPVLGASTKHYKAYGKRTTNIVNRPTQLTTRNEPDWARDTSSSSSSDSDDNRPPPVRVPTISWKPLSGNKGNVGLNGRSGGRSSFELVIEKTVKNRPKKAVAAAGKENVPIVKRDATEAKPKVVQSTSDASAARPRKRVESAESIYPVPAVNCRAIGADKPVRRGSESGVSDDLVRPARRPTLRKRVVISSAESEQEAPPSPSPPTTPSPVVSDLSSISAASAPQSSEAHTTSRVPPETDDLPPLALAQLDLTDAGDGDDESRGEYSYGRRRRSRASIAVASGTVQGRASSSRRLPSASTHPRPPQLAPLLPSLLSPTIYSFTSFVSSPPPPLANRAVSSWWTKIGEASYSEVYSTVAEEGDTQAGTVVVKIIPIADPSDRGVSVVDDEEEEEMPFMSDWSAVHREVETSRLLGGEQSAVDGFVRFKG